MLAYFFVLCILHTKINQKFVLVKKHSLASGIEIVLTISTGHYMHCIATK